MASEARESGPTVSFGSEQLILVDHQDNAIGRMSKARCHEGRGVLHRAFSLFIFDEAGRLLLQQRSGEKRLWPLYWSNSCCSHPRWGETMETATRRRLVEELGIEAELRYVYKFIYQADFRDVGAEHELCWVYIGRSTQPVRANPNEVESWRFVSCSDLDLELKQRPEDFTPWFRMEWQRLRGEYRDVMLDWLDETRPSGRSAVK